MRNSTKKAFWRSTLSIRCQISISHQQSYPFRSCASDRVYPYTSKLIFSESEKYRGDKAVTNFDKSNYSKKEIETFKFPHRAHVRDDTNNNSQEDDNNEDENLKSAVAAKIRDKGDKHPETLHALANLALYMMDEVKRMRLKSARTRQW